MIHGMIDAQSDDAWLKAKTKRGRICTEQVVDVERFFLWFVERERLRPLDSGHVACLGFCDEG